MTGDADRAGIRARIADALGALPEQQRDVVVSRMLEDRSTRETADRLGIAEGTVKAARNPWLHPCIPLHSTHAMVRSMSNNRALRAVTVSAVLLLVVAASSHAQSLTVHAGGGLAVPSGGAAEFRSTGPSALLSLGYDFAGPWGVRLDAEFARLHGRPAPGSASYGDLSAYGLSLNGILGGTDGAISPYLLVGGGAYALQQQGRESNPYGITAAFQAGAGLNLNVFPRINPFLETRATVHTTDYGSREMSATVYWPLTVGVRL